MSDSSPRSHAAAGIENPCFGAVRISAGMTGATAARSSRFFCSPRTLCTTGVREREVGDDGVEERHARLERVRHRRAVGLHELVVDEVDAEVDVLQAREHLRPRRLREPRAVEVDRVEVAAAAVEQLAADLAARAPDVQPQWRSSGGSARAAAKRLALSSRRRAPDELGSRSMSGRSVAASGPSRGARRSAVYVL